MLKKHLTYRKTYNNLLAVWILIFNTLTTRGAEMHLDVQHIYVFFILEQWIPFILLNKFL
jgi:hypothetical protein